MKPVKNDRPNQDYDLENQTCRVSQWRHSPVLRSHTPAEVMPGGHRASTDSGTNQTDVVPADRGMKNCWCNCSVNTAARPLAAYCCLSGISQHGSLALQTHQHYTRVLNIPGFRKTRVFLKPNPVGFLGFIGFLVLLDAQCQWL